MNQQKVNLQTSSNETTPSDDDVDDNDNNDDEEHMDETDFSLVKTVMHNSNNLDIRKTVAANVFCCGDKDGGGVIAKLLGHNKNKKGTGPGQAVQVITHESGITRVFLDDNEIKSKKLKMAENI